MKKLLILGVIVFLAGLGGMAWEFWPVEEEYDPGEPYCYVDEYGDEWCDDIQPAPALEDSSIEGIIGGIGALMGGAGALIGALKKGGK